MGDDRLMGLALMHVHRDIELSTDKVIDDFAKLLKTRLDFVLQSFLWLACSVYICCDNQNKIMCMPLLLRCEYETVAYL